MGDNSSDNTDTGVTVAVGGSLIFGQPKSVPPTAVLTVSSGGYVTLGAPTLYRELEAATTTTLTSDADPDNPPVYGDSVAFTATVSPANPGLGMLGGSVDFFDESTQTDLGTVTTLTNNGDGTYGATLTVSDLDAEDHYIVAAYTPAENEIFVASVSNPFDQEVEAATTTTVLTASENSPTYGNSLTLTATVSAPGSALTVPGGDGETVDFYDETTGVDLGTVNLVANGDGTSSATWETSALSLGSQTITAVYSGDDNFAGSQSTQSVSIVGEGLSVSVGSIQSPGSAGVGTLSGSVSGLDGAAFTVAVDWGDGLSGADSQDFYFAAGTDLFTLNHYYVVNINATEGSTTVTNLGTGDGGGANVTEKYPISVAVTPTDRSDPRQATGSTSVSLTDLQPRFTLTCTSDGNGGYSFTVGAYDYWHENTTFSCQWTTPDGSSSGDTIALNAQQFNDGGTLTVSDANGAAMIVPFGDLTSYQDPGPPPDQPTITISESDTNGMVFEGDQADFTISLDHAVGYDVTVFYNTVDPSGTPVTDYQSTYGPQEVVIAAGNTDATIPPVATTGGINGGGDGSVEVQLSHPWWGVLGTSTATATIVHPDVTISSPGMPSGTFQVADDGTRTEVDLSAVMDAAFAEEGNTSLQLTLPEGDGGLTYWTAQTGGTQLYPDGNGVVETFAMPGSGTFTGTIWVAVDPSNPPPTDPDTGRPDPLPIAFELLGPAASQSMAVPTSGTLSGGGTGGTSSTTGPDVQFAALGPGGAAIVATAMLAAAPPQANVTYDTPGGTFTITTGSVPITDPAQQLVLGLYNWGYTITYQFAPGVQAAPGYTLILVQALNSSGPVTGSQPHFDADLPNRNTYFNHQELPQYGPPLKDRPYNPRIPLLGSGHTFTITVAADCQEVDPKTGTFHDEIVGCLSFTFYDELNKAVLYLPGKPAINDPAKTTTTLPATAHDKEWDKALAAWMDWKPGP
jgi:hypothetical protein